MNHIVNKRTKGILLLILSAFFFACMNMFVKLSGEELPVFQKVFFRNAMAAIIIYSMSYSRIAKQHTSEPVCSGKY